jgi:copper chaperone CopZ
MNIEYEINKIKNQLQNLQEVVLNMARNSVPTTSKVDDTANQVKAITPYTETKTAYIGDTEISFDNVPSGNLSVFADNISEYSTDRVGSTLNIDFYKPLEEVTEVTISIS